MLVLVSWAGSWAPVGGRGPDPPPPVAPPAVFRDTGIFAATDPWTAHAEVTGEGCPAAGAGPSLASLRGLDEVSGAAFYCAMVRTIDRYNDRIDGERRFLRGYVERLHRNGPDGVTEEDGVRMARILIKYRALGDGEGGAHYFSAARYKSPSMRDAVIERTARERVGRSGPPVDCVRWEGGGWKEGPLTGDGCFGDLLKKIQPIPSSMVAVQAMKETGNGSSRQARRDFNYFGLQALFRSPETMAEYSGCRPAERNPRRCILRFDDDPAFLGSLDEYFNRFNASPLGLYADFRERRWDMIEGGRSGRSCSDARSLAGRIGGYAEDPGYVEGVAGMIGAMCPIGCAAGRAE